MALPVISLEVDGVAYQLRRLGAMDALRVDTMAGRMLGPVLRALAMSDDASSLMSALTVGESERVQAVLEKDVGAMLGMLGLTLDELAEKLDPEDVVKLAGLLFFGGRLRAPAPGGGSVEIDGADTYEHCLGPALAEHGHMHQLKLLWAALRANLGPTTAGSTTDTTTSKG